MLPQINPMTLTRQKEAFNHPDWLFEVKHDGFRAVAYVEDGKCKLVSRNGNTFQRFKELAKSVASTLESRSAIMDGEIVCLDENGHSLFYELMNGKGKPSFYAFDLLFASSLSCSSPMYSFSPVGSGKATLSTLANSFGNSLSKSQAYACHCLLSPACFILASASCTNSACAFFIV